MANEFVEQVLVDISDTRLLGQRRNTDSPLADLIIAYNELVVDIDHFEFMKDENTGRELKEAIGKLEIHTQVALLNQFSENLKKTATPYGYESVRERDNNLFRHRMMMILSIGLILLLTGVIGSLISIAYFSGEIKGPMIKPYIDGVVEIFKVIFGVKG